MHEITAYVPDGTAVEPLYRTAKGALKHELRDLLREATQSMPSSELRGGSPLHDLLLDMLTTEIYPTVPDKLVEAIDYFREHRAVLRGPGIGN